MGLGANRTRTPEGTDWAGDGEGFSSAIAVARLPGRLDIAEVIELVAVAVLALHGILCSAILGVYLWHQARARDARPEHRPEAPEKLEPPDLGYLDAERYPAREIFAIMREFFPDEYERYRSGRMGFVERRWTWDACRSLQEARAEIEELCS